MSTEARDAVSVVLAPIDMPLMVDEDFTEFVKKRLIGNDYKKDDEAEAEMLGTKVLFIVYETKPEGKVKIVPATAIEILNEPIGEVRRKEKLAEFKRVKSFGKNLLMYLEDETLRIRVTDYERRYWAQTPLTLEEVNDLANYLKNFLIASNP